MTSFLIRQLLGGTLLLGLLLQTANAAEATGEPQLRLETGMHTAVINRIATDAAGRWAVTASHDKTARVWEVASGKLLQVLRPPQGAGDEGKLYAVALSPDGATVAVGGWTEIGSDTGNTIYLFDRASGRLLRRILEQPNVINHLAWSPDGRWIVASLGGNNGIRLFDAASGTENGRDADYDGDSYSAHFSGDSQHLVITCGDGQVRLYAVEAGRLRLLKAVRRTGSEPFTARFSPDSRLVAVGYSNSNTVQVLDGGNLAAVAQPTTSGVNNGNLSSVAWSADGRFLFAAGRWNVDGKYTLRRWNAADWSPAGDLPLTNNTLTNLAPLPDGGVLFAAGDPAWGAIVPEFALRHHQVGQIADFRDQQLPLSADGRRLRFGYRPGGDDPRSFDLVDRSPGADLPELNATRSTAPGLNIRNWEDADNPSLNGVLLPLEQYEYSRSLAIAGDAAHFVLGSEWGLRLFDRDGKQVWRQSVPGVVWAVNISADGRFVVAGYGDGTIRWHRFADGCEILALFPHADRKRWIVWTPEGYFDASPGAEELIGYHLNNGIEREGEFVSAAQLREIFYQPGLIGRRLDADGDLLVAEQVKKRGDVRQLLAAGPRPALELRSTAAAQSDGTYRLQLEIKSLGQSVGQETSRLIVRVDGQELAGRWQRPVLTPGGIIDLPLDLAQGQRTVTAELVDARGIGSAPVRVSVLVNRPADTQPARLHVLAVGITNYRDSALKLKHAAADAEEIARQFKVRSAPLFRGGTVVRTLTDKDATVERIGRTLAEMAADARPEDTFVLFLAGHGTTLDGEFYFMPWELEYENDAALRSQAISQIRLREWLSRLPLRALLLLDSCRAGGLLNLPARASEDKDSLSKLIRLSQRAVIVATSADRIALEGHKGHGVFSWVVLDALKNADYDENGQVDVSEIAMHVRKLVPEITEKKFKYRQVPMQDTPGDPFGVAVPEAKKAAAGKSARH